MYEITGNLIYKDGTIQSLHTFEREGVYPDSSPSGFWVGHSLFDQSGRIGFDLEDVRVMVASPYADSIDDQIKMMSMKELVSLNTSPLSRDQLIVGCIVGEDAESDISLGTLYWFSAELDNENEAVCSMRLEWDPFDVEDSLNDQYFAFIAHAEELGLELTEEDRESANLDLEARSGQSLADKALSEFLEQNDMNGKSENNQWAFGVLRALVLAASRIES